MNHFCRQCHSWNVSLHSWPLRLLPHRCVTPSEWSVLINKNERHTHTHSGPNCVSVFGERRLHMGTPASLFCVGSQADVTWSNRSPYTDIRRIAVQFRLLGAPQPSASRVPSLPHTHTHYIHRYFMLVLLYYHSLFINITEMIFMFLFLFDNRIFARSYFILFGWVLVSHIKIVEFE